MNKTLEFPTELDNAWDKFLAHPDVYALGVFNRAALKAVHEGDVDFESAAYAMTSAALQVTDTDPEYTAIDAIKSLASGAIEGDLESWDELEKLVRETA